ncbi:GNAT family N-acetyltransferase [Leptolyngbya sp. FACHB-261]|uniref:GNAT family N-acetyltransferase n=1 Tax=Leptolyngbya sp. FACHB-261 TaxID=2692806 RepID=UPI0016890DC1|nr:GNAT family protein [Leptolyngbya sp. FACHB-261]MBD2104708.1 GNAT family N-acetyltransferase [Leptolyngbya sp. FACHB-261]
MELQTSRLVLKRLDASTAPEVLAYFERNREFFQPWSPTVPPDFYTLEFHRRKLQKELERWAEGQTLRLWLFKKEALSNTLIGDLVLTNITRGAFQSCHLGYKLDRQWINQGLMTEALSTVLPFAFQSLKLHRVEANIMPRNQRSIRVVEKLGFVNEGLSRQYLKINGVWEDHWHYVMLNPVAPAELL